MFSFFCLVQWNFLLEIVSIIFKYVLENIVNVGLSCQTFKLFLIMNMIYDIFKTIKVKCPSVRIAKWYDVFI